MCLRVRACVCACVRVQCPPPRSSCPTVERAGACGDEADVVRGAVERETVAVHVVVEVGEVTANVGYI